MSAPSDARFPSTRLSVLHALRAEDAVTRRAALETLMAIYWHPVYARFRVRWSASPADAEDLTQEFLARSVDDGLFERFDPDRARFRTYLRLCADRFAAKAIRDRGRLKRGGAMVGLPVETVELEHEAGAPGRSADDPDADACFEREWVRAVFADAVARLRDETAGTTREVRFALLQRYDLDPERDADRPSYRALADEFALPVTQVTNHLAWARRELRRLVLERLRSLAASDAELRDDIAAVLGRQP